MQPHTTHNPPTQHPSLPPSNRTGLGDDGRSVFEEFLAHGYVSLSPEHAATAYAVGHAFYEREQFARASDLFRFLALSRPQDARSWFSLAACHDAVGDEETAAEIYRIAAGAPEGASDRHRALVYLARTLLRQARGTEAQECIDQFLEGASEDDTDPALLRLAADVQNAANELNQPRGRRS